MSDIVLNGSMERVGEDARISVGFREAIWKMTQVIGRGCARLANAMELGAVELRAIDRTRQNSVN